LDEFTASRTALATSLMRAAHTRLDPNPLIDDSWGDRLVPAAVREMIRSTALSRMDPAARLKAMAAPDGIVDASLRRSPAYANVIMRTRYTEDALQAAELTDAGSLVTPLPGTVVAVHVSQGQRVERGAPLMTIEAMKMEHTVTAPYAGIVDRLPYGLADRVAEGAVLVELSPLDG